VRRVTPWFVGHCYKYPSAPATWLLLPRCHLPVCTVRMRHSPVCSVLVCVVCPALAFLGLNRGQNNLRSQQWWWVHRDRSPHCRQPVITTARAPIPIYVVNSLTQAGTTQDRHQTMVLSDRGNNITCYQAYYQHYLAYYLLRQHITLHGRTAGHIPAGSARVCSACALTRRAGRAACRPSQVTGRPGATSAHPQVEGVRTSRGV
jgi:hypothetical protein